MLRTGLRLFGFCLLSSCSLTHATSYFGVLESGDKAQRVLVKNVGYSKEFEAYLKSVKIDPKKTCAQKFAYQHQKANYVMLELHDEPCQNKPLTKPLLVAQWKYEVSPEGKFSHSFFAIGDRVVGESAPASDTLQDICSGKYQKDCGFVLEKGEQKIVLK